MKSCKEFKTTKQFIALLLTVSLICTAAACNKKDKTDADMSSTTVSATQGKNYPVTTSSSETSSESSTETSSESSTSEVSSAKTNSTTRKAAKRNKAPAKTVFYKRKAYYEFSDNKLNNLIDRIKKVNCGSEIDMNEYVRAEIEEINKKGYFEYNHEFPNQNYKWFKNGTIDVDALAKKITSNNITGNQPVTNQIKEYIQATAEAAQKDYEYLKRNYPGFKLSFLLHKLDKLKVGLTDKEEVMASYTRTEHMIVFNPNNLTGGYDDTLVTAAHEIFHVGLEVNEPDYVVYQCGTSIDVLTNINTALDLSFMNENYADSMSYEACGFYDPMSYTTEMNYINFIASSCVIDRSVLRKAYVNMDNSKLIDIFEPELQDYVNVTSAFSYANCACGYGYFYGIKFDENLLADCRENFFTFMIKNYYIKQLKRYYYDEIGKNELKELLNLINSFAMDFGVDNDKTQKIIQQMTDIVLNCK